MNSAPSTRVSTITASWGRTSHYRRCHGSEYEEQELSEESLQSEFKLPYFKVCLFATVLEDAITKLRILEECNTELKLKKISSDMITLLANKHHVEPMPVKDELDQIDPKRLGCLEYTLKKLEADRAFTIKVLKDTYLNLTTMRQFDCLSHSVVETKERRQRFHLLMEEEAKNKWLYRDICRQLRQLRNHIKSVTYDRNNVIEILKSSVQDAELNSAAHSRYVTGWQRARSEQHAQTITDREAAPAANIELYKTKIDQEQHVHSEVELLFNIKIQEVLEKVEGWMKKYEKDMENIELKIQRKKNEHDITYERRLKLEETIEKHVALMKNWVTFKEEREAARLYREKMFHSAVTIQAWWRGLLVRKQLGPYKVGKKRGPAPKSAEKSKKKK